MNILSKYGKTITNLGLLVLIVLSETIIRFRSIKNPASVDWDEDGFIETGRLLIGYGKLPFVSTYEQKPPLGSLIYGFPFIFNHGSAVTVRFFAGLVIALSAFLLTSINTTNVSMQVRFVVATTFITFVSVMPSGLGWMTEINSILITSCLIFVYWRWLFYKQSDFILGIFISAMPLVRTNLGIPALFLLILITVTNRFNPMKILRIYLGASITVILVATPYAVQGHMKQLWNGMLGIHLANFSEDQSFHVEFGKKQLVILLLSVIFIELTRRRIYSHLFKDMWEENHSQLKLFYVGLVLLFIGTCVSIVFDQPNFAHHLLQICPFPITFIWLLITFSRGAFLEKSKFSWFLATVLLSACAVLISNVSSGFTQKYEKEKEIQKCVDSFVPAKSEIWSLNSIFLYWRSDFLPASPLLIHPSTILMQSYLKIMADVDLNQNQALDQIFSIGPSYIIRNEGPSYIPSKLLERMNAKLEKNYSYYSGCESLKIQIYKKIED